MQVDPVEGRILIDGIDISSIGIHDLRSRVVRGFALALIPQTDPKPPRRLSSHKSVAETEK
jgi:hypothetical protein